MALLTNINGKFSVSDAGAVTFNNAFTFPTTDGAANYVLQTNGSGQLAWALNGNGDISGSGTANTVTKFTGAKTIILGDGPITFSGNNSTFTGNVGIGTNAPVSRLEVYGGTSGTNDVDRYVRFKASNGEKRFDFYMGGTGNASSLGMYTSDGTTKNVQIAAGGTSYFNGGNVGIGTTSPSYNLDVESTTVNNQTIARFSSSGGVRAIINTDSDDDGSFSLYDKNDAAQVLIRSLGSSYFNGGNVGIGTTSPSAKLMIETGSDEGIRIYRSGANANFGAIEFRNNDDSATNSRIGFNANEMRLEATNQFRFVTNSSDRMFINSIGNIGIGTTSPSAPLHISNTYPVIRLTDSDGTAPYAQIINSSGILQLRADDGNSTANSSMQFFVDGTERLTINSSGNATFTNNFKIGQLVQEQLQLRLFQVI